MKSMRGAAVWLSFVCLILCPSLRASDLEKQLKSDYVGKTLTLRRFYEGDRLKFHPDGTLQGDAPVGPWTLDGQIAVEQIHLQQGTLEIHGRRVNVIFDAKQRPVDQLTTLDRFSGKERKKIEKALREQRVRIEIELPSASPSQDDIALALHKVFLMVGESMIDVVPPFWRSCVAEMEGKPATVPQSVPGVVYKVSPTGSQKGGVTPPHAIRSPDPEYSDEARRTKYQGIAVVWMIIEPDGETKDIRIVRPLGLGLDEKALSAISTWKFEPARKDGTPVAVMVNVEVSFKLY